MLGRPVFFVDGDPARDAQAEAALRKAAQRAGFRELEFQYEPIAAAFDYEQGVDARAEGAGRRHRRRHLRLLGRARRPGAAPARLDRKGDILANHGVHIAGTDFDRRVELAAILPLLRLRRHRRLGRRLDAARGAERGLLRPRDLAPHQHRLQPAARAELRRMRTYYGDPVQHRRLMTVVEERLGHDLLSRAEAAKIAVSEGGAVRDRPRPVEARPRCRPRRGERRERARCRPRSHRRRRARRPCADAGLAPAAIDALYFTGGSTGLRMLADRIAAGLPGGPRGARRSLRQRRHRAGPLRAAPLRAGPAPEGDAPPSTAIAVADQSRQSLLNRRSRRPSPAPPPRRCRC